MGRCLNKCLLWGALGCFDQPDVLKNWSVGTSQTEGCRKSSVSAHQVQRAGLLITRECLGWWDGRVTYKENGKNESTSSARRWRGQEAGWLGEAHSMWDGIWTLWWTSQFIWKESLFSPGGCIQFNTNRLPLVSVPQPGTSCRVCQLNSSSFTFTWGSWVLRFANLNTLGFLEFFCLP